MAKYSRLPKKKENEKVRKPTFRVIFHFIYFFFKLWATHKRAFQINEKVVAAIKDPPTVVKHPVNWQHSAQAV